MSFEFRTQLPRGSRLVADHAADRAEARSFLPSSATSANAYVAQARSVAARFDSVSAPPWLDGVRAYGARARARLDAVREGRGFVVTTGQQPGLFAGPLYSLYKAISAACLADALEPIVGRPVAPVFWTASEDHDWQEVNHTQWIDVANQLHELALPDGAGAGALPLHRLPMGPGIETVLDRVAQMSPDTEVAATYLRLFRAEYRPDATLPQAFEAVLAHLLEPLGVLFVQAHDPWLKAASREVLRTELEHAEEHEHRLARQAVALERAGYPVQVPILEDGVNLFVEGSSGRERLYRDTDGFHLRHSGERYSPAELEDLIASDPARISPNVLLRPVVESAVLPTLAYVAGPGEMAYFGQLAPLFEAHAIAMPVVAPRLGGWVVEAKVDKVIRKFDLDFDELGRPFHEVATDLARDEVPEEIQRALGKVRGAIGAGVGELTQAVRELDPTLKGPAGHVRSVAFDALGDFERKVMQAVKRENEITLQQVEKAHVHLFPQGRLQERVMNPLYYLMRYGDSFVPELARSFADALPLRLGEH